MDGYREGGRDGGRDGREGGFIPPARREAYGEIIKLLTCGVKESMKMYDAMPRPASCKTCVSPIEKDK